MAKINNIDERTEGLFRIIVLIVSGIILSVWKMLIQVLAIINFLITVITAERNQELAEFSEYWNTETYRFLKYITFVSNERPFPFTEMRKRSKFEK